MSFDVTSLPRPFPAAVLWVAFALCPAPKATAACEPSAAERQDLSTAAHIDWRPGCALTGAEAAGLPFFCDGRYVEPEFESTLDPTTQPVSATSLRGQYQLGGFSELEGEVSIEQGNRHLTADWASVDQESDTIEFSGNVRFREPGILLTATAGEATMADERGQLVDSTFLLHASRLRGTARQLSREDGRILIEDGTFTRCGPFSNVWSMVGKEIRLDPDTGIGTARQLTVRLKDRPVLYTPYLRFPIDDRRQSGFLMPSISHDSDGGLDISAPYYLNLAPNYDLTYTPRPIRKRGFLHDGEFRFLSPRTNNSINATFLAGDRVFDDRTLIDHTREVPDFLQPFDEQDRWLLHVTHGGTWSPSWTTNLRYSAVSDMDYLHDFGGDVDSVAVDRFLTNVTSSLGNRRSPSLSRVASVEYRTGGWVALLKAQGFQALGPDVTENYEQLPQLLISHAGKLAFLDYNLELEFVSFDKDNDDLTGILRAVGDRGAVDLEVNASWRSLWGFLTPSFSLRHREYSLKDEPAGTPARVATTVPSFSLDTGIYLDRFFEHRGTAVQQTLEPRVHFLVTREKTIQNLIPRFDATELTPGFRQLFRDNRFSGKDRIGDARQLGVGITTRFIDRGTGTEHVALNLGQIYYFKDRTVFYEAPRPGIDPTASHSALYTDIGVTFASWRLRGSLEWEPRNGVTNRGGVTFRYQPDYRHIVNLRYRYTNPDVGPITEFAAIEESDVTFIWPLADRWSAIGKWNFGWDQNQTIESFFGVEYQTCCWKTRLVFRRFLKDPRLVTIIEPDPNLPGATVERTELRNRADTGVFFEFQLKGLATLGKRLDSLLDEGIEGYRQREDHYHAQ